MVAIITALAIRVIRHSSIAVVVATRRSWPFRHPSPKKWPGPRMATTASLPCSETTVSLTLPCWTSGRRSALAPDFEYHGAEEDHDRPGNAIPGRARDRAAQG